MYLIAERAYELRRDINGILGLNMQELNICFQHLLPLLYLLTTTTTTTTGGQ
jgi:hypothetical protein